MKSLIYPFQEQIIKREELLHQYVAALDENDTSTLAQILAIAKNDPTLAKLIDEMEIAFAYP